MKSIGKISNIEVAYQELKSRDDGSQYWGERYNIFFEVGDDIHIINSGFLHVNGMMGGLARLESKGIKVGAIGEMQFHYGFRDWNGRKFVECDFGRFTPLAATQQQAPAPSASPEQAQPEASSGEEAPKAEESGEGDNLPF